MKKLFTIVLLFAVALSASAQFEKGKKYVGASATGLGFSYSSNEKFRFGLEARAGYFVADCLMLTANLGYDHTRAVDDVAAGLGVRYYFDQCGVHVGAGLEYDHFTPDNNDVMIPLNVGYNFALLDNLEVSVFTGPVFDFNITAKGVLDPNFTGPAPTGSDNLLDNGWKRFDCQWGFGVGVTFAHSYYIGVSGGIGISPLASYNIGGDTYRMRRNSFSIALGYNF